MLQIAVLSQLAMHAGADPLRLVTPLVPASLLVLCTKTSCVKQVVDQCPRHSMQGHVTTGLVTQLLRIPVLLQLVCCVFGLLHISLHTRCTNLAEL